MCGIFGRVNRNAPIDKDLFLTQLNKIANRGPDAFGTFFDGNVGLGHRRLSIVDLSENGNQPMFNEDKSIAIIFNGEIYNYKQVLARLRDEHTLRSKSDTEALLHGYEEFGVDLTKYIEGLFAFCIYDRKNKQLFFARDHFGKKPLYYYYDDETFVFGSELKTILQDVAIKKKLTLDRSSIEKFLFYGYIPSPHSIFNQIHKLEPASYMVFDINLWLLHENIRFWHPEQIAVVDTDEDTVLADVESLLDKAVEKRLMSDVPLGIFLSGGVDSSLIAHYLANKTNNLTSYTISYPQYQDIDEARFAKVIAEKNGFRYNLIDFESEHVLENFTGIMDYLDEPLADAAIVPLYYMSKLSKKDMTVVLSGDGGDELFAGYSKYTAQNVIEQFKWLGFATGLLEKLIPDSSEMKKAVKLFTSDFEIRQFMFGSGSFYNDEAQRLLKTNLNARLIFEDAYAHNKEFIQHDIINRSTYLDWKLQLPDWYLVKSDRAAMANSQETRSPLLDKELAEYVLSIPGNIKMKNGQSKYILKKLLAKYYPADFVNRKKRGFGVPLDKWIRSELKDLFVQYIPMENGVFDTTYSKQLLHEHMLGAKDNRFKLLRIFCFNYFYKNIWNS